MPGTHGYHQQHQNARKAIDTDEAGAALFWLFLAVLVLALAVLAGAVHAASAKRGAAHISGLDVPFVVSAEKREDAA